MGARLFASWIVIALALGSGATSVRADKDHAAAAEKGEARPPAVRKRVHADKRTAAPAASKQKAARGTAPLRPVETVAQRQQAPAPARPIDSAPAPQTAVAPDQRLHRQARTDEGGIASARPQIAPIGSSKRAAAPVAKREVRVGVGLPPAGSTNPSEREVASPLQTALAQVETAVLTRYPKASGKITISFTIGQNGRLRDVIVLGFDKDLDAELEKQVAGVRLPAQYAGQPFSTNLVFRAGKVTRR